jgi:hypothetical protein
MRAASIDSSFVTMPLRTELSDHLPDVRLYEARKY